MLFRSCAHCHRFNGGGSSYFFVPFDLSLRDTKAIGGRPTQGTFGIHDAQLLAPGDPYRSLIYYRMAKTGPGHMPHLGAKMIDERALPLMRAWIRQLPTRLEETVKIDQLIDLEEPRALAREGLETLQGTECRSSRPPASRKTITRQSRTPSWRRRAVAGFCANMRAARGPRDAPHFITEELRDERNVERKVGREWTIQNRIGHAPAAANLHCANVDFVHFRRRDGAIGLFDQFARDTAPTQFGRQRQAYRPSANDQNRHMAHGLLVSAYFLVRISNCKIGRAHV